MAYTTYTAARAAYFANAGYMVDNSTTKAKAFIEACVDLIGFCTKASESGDNRVEDDPTKYEKRLEHAMSWWQANDSSATSSRPSGSIKHADFREFRA
ncbi:MAG TPA: hypothetical protein VMY37_20600 [Thermoguttaceae bacterium]|nr:hypothetical protein [Thermoguttaceae bacterium]